MKSCIAFFLMIMFTSCKEEAIKNSTIENNSKTFCYVGKTLYSKFCVQCHGSKTANDNILWSNIQNNKYELSFLIDYINNQDSLLELKNELAIKIKKDWNTSTEYHHNFKLTDQEIKTIVYYLKN